ncbi:MAG TPA: lysylphosphatidylglycerol synthase domain-containing protein, partial [Chitinophagaceae bacterium]|nr:lysylphosphatidylglycerol synthase domain-containing protein [Chitinophagaceae bacterium]
LICMLIAAGIEFKRLGNFFRENILNPIIEKIELITRAPLLLGATIIFLLGSIAGFAYLIRKNKNQAKESVISKLITGFADGLRSVANLKNPGEFIFHSILIWVLYYFSVYVALYAFKFTDDLGANAALFLLVAGGIGMSAPVQGGIGAYHLLVSQGLLLYGISEENGLAFATLLHSLQILLIVVFGMISLLFLFIGSKKSGDAVLIKK